MKKLLTALIISAMTLSLFGCGEQALPREETATATEETTSATQGTTATEMTIPETTATETAVQTAETAIDIAEAVKNYKYQPPKEVLNTHFYSADIEAEIEFEDYMPESYNWGNFYDEGYREVLHKEFYKRYPKEIVDDMDNETAEGVPIYQTDYKIISMGDMRYDLNSDGVKDYIMHGWMSIDGSINRGADVYRVYIYQNDGRYKSVELPEKHRNQNKSMYILSSKTNGLNDIKVLCNSNQPTEKYDGKSSYTGAKYVDEEHIFGGWRQVSETVIEYNMMLGIGSGGISQYVAINFKDNPYLKESVLYTCNPDGTPKAIDDFNDIVFYAELKDGVKLPEDFEWEFYPDEIKYIPAE